MTTETTTSSPNCIFNPYYCVPLAGLPGVYLETARACTSAVLAKTDRPLAVEWPPGGAERRWTVSQWLGGRGTLVRQKFTTAADARAALIGAAAAALAKLPPCGWTHDEHLANWKSWRDDCVDPVVGCGFAVRDVDQCERGHPDDGVEYCGACGHDITGRLTCPDHHVRMVARANGCWHCPAEGCLSAFHTSACLPA